MYKGARVPGGDYFDDVLGDNREAGIHKGMGLDDFDRVSEELTPDGVAMSQLSCRACGNHADLEVTWEELFYVANNGPGKPLVLPQGWARSERNMSCYFQVKCPKCSDGYYAVHFTPDEAKSRLAQAANSGLVTEQQAAAWAQKIAMYTGQARR
jgi:hypothetical protein